MDDASIAQVAKKALEGTQSTPAPDNAPTGSTASLTAQPEAPKELAAPDISPLISKLLPGITGPVSEVHKKLSSVAKILEDHPILAHLALAGLKTLDTGATGSETQSS